jgi:hypothetical protein
VDPVFRIHLDPADEVQLDDRLVEFRIRHALQALPDFSRAALWPRASRLLVSLAAFVHGDHGAA